jgi:hypothetical protein
VRRVVALAVLVLLAACGKDGDGARPAATAAPAGPLVTMKRYGGIAGLTDRVEVDRAGRAIVTSDRSALATERQLPPDQLAALRTALERSEFSTLERNYLDRNAADAFQYDVGYQGATVTTDEGVVPPRLRPVVDILSGLLARP